MKQIDSIKGSVLFTDIKNFTLKSSLLTQVQIDKILNKQDEIIFPIIKKYFGQIIKSLGDSYMIIFEKAENAVYAGTEIQNKLYEYNLNIKLNLYKIELRITADYGDIDRKLSINGEDYLGIPVNISSRLQSITPENKLFITGTLYNEIKSNLEFTLNYLGKTTFKGILFDVEVYDVLFLKNDINLLNSGKYDIKKIDDFFITDDMKKSIENIDSIILKFASVAAIIGIQPIPFLDIYGLLPLHLYLLTQIAKEYGIELSKNESKEIFSTIMGSIGGSYILSQGMVGISKVGFLGLGGYIMIPLNFGLTYSIGKVLSYYLYKKSQGVKSTNKELNNLFKYSINSGKKIAKNDKDKILKMGKKYKDIFSEKIKSKK